MALCAHRAEPPCRPCWCAMEVRGENGPQRPQDARRSDSSPSVGGSATDVVTAVRDESRAPGHIPYPAWLRAVRAAIGGER